MGLRIVVVILALAAAGTADDFTGTQCERNNECHVMFGSDSYCRENICFCKDSESKPKPCDSTKIKHTNIIGGNCTHARHCMISKSECDLKTKTCVCIEKYVASADRRSCLLFAESLGDKCAEDIQCKHLVSPLSFCSGQKCTCENGTIMAKDTCWSPSDINEKCTSSEECSHINHSDCIDDVCKCHENFVPKMDGKKCLPVAVKWDDNCTESNQCEYGLGEGYHCLNGACRCSELYHLNVDKTLCVRDTKVGFSCSKHSDCHPAGAEEESYKMECFLNKCQCRYPFVEKNEFCSDDGFMVRPFSSAIYVSILIIFFIY